MTSTADIPQVNFGDYQQHLYAAGRLDGSTPPFTTNIAAIVGLARSALPEPASGVVFGNAGSGATAEANVSAFDRWRILPRQLRGSARRYHATTVMGPRWRPRLSSGPSAYRLGRTPRPSWPRRRRRTRWG